MKQLLLFLICNLTFLLTVQGNSTEIPLAVMFKQLSTTEGLSNNSIRSIYRDNRGFLWVGTESGLNKYDGYSFQQYYQNNSNLAFGHGRRAHVHGHTGLRPTESSGLTR